MERPNPRAAKLSVELLRGHDWLGEGAILVDLQGSIAAEGDLENGSLSFLLSRAQAGTKSNPN